MKIIWLPRRRATSLVVMIAIPMFLMAASGDCHLLHPPPKLGHINATQVNNEARDQEDDTQSSSFIRFLFKKYGRGGVMTFEGLEHLLDNLGLGQVNSFGHALQSHIDEDGNFIEFHDDHLHNGELHRADDHHHDDHHHDDHHHDDHHLDDHHHDNHHHGNHSHDDQGSVQHLGHDAENSAVVDQKKLSNESNSNFTCLSAKEILRTFHIQYSGGIQTSQFLSLCPALVYQLDQQLCRSKPFLGHSHDGGDESSFYFNPWVGAFSAVCIISVAGLVVVGIIPAISSCAFYHGLVQFLISLAVGTLTADALLHLLPHAMIPHSHHHAQHSHQEDEATHNKHPIWVGLVTFCAILLFFLVERLLKISSDTRARRRDQKKSSRWAHPAELLPSSRNETSEKPLEMIYLKNESETDQKHVSGAHVGSVEKPKDVIVRHEFCGHADAGMDVVHRHDDDKELYLGCEDGGSKGQKPPHDHHHHHLHHHHHGHSHEVPSSIASVAWMVIMGDGLHNFTDGLAIGTSFSNGLPIGLSTSVAVLCHELPHELGDFAVLLRSGMTMKQALVCNFLSSILCFFGACLGVAIGNTDSITSWVFSITAGIFIYIALVDMLPQITSAYDDATEDATDDTDDRGGERMKRARNFFKGSLLLRLLLHTIGIVMGLSLMLVIAVYEDSIRIEIN